MGLFDNIKTVYSDSPPSNTTTDMYVATVPCLLKSIYIANNNDDPHRISVGILDPLEVPSATNRLLHSALFPGKDDMKSKRVLEYNRKLEPGQRVACTMPTSTGNWLVEVNVVEEPVE